MRKRGRKPTLQKTRTVYGEDDETRSQIADARSHSSAPESAASLVQQQQRQPTQTDASPINIQHSPGYQLFLENGQDFHDSHEDNRGQPEGALAAGYANSVSELIRRSSSIAHHSQEVFLSGYNQSFEPEHCRDPSRTSHSAASRRAPSDFRPLHSPEDHLRPYKCLEPLLPLLKDVISTEVSCDLLEFYFAQPGSSLFQSASPYVLSHVLRKTSLLHSTNPRETTSALIATILWVSAQTADIPLLLLSGVRARICEALRKLSMWLLQQRDRDNWQRIPGT